MKDFPPILPFHSCELICNLIESELKDRARVHKPLTYANCLIHGHVYTQQVYEGCSVLKKKEGKKRKKSLIMVKPGCLEIQT